MTDTLNSYIYYFTTDYYPPKWFNKVEERQLIKSNFMFSTTYLVMPFFFLAFILIKVIKRSEKGVLFIILSGSAILNAFFHALAGRGLDRYLQWGYPLNLICIVILAIYFSRAIIQIPNIVKQRLHKKNTEEHGMLTGR
jgi:FlaA1/EpsC-like NDP-sugar epimerase